MVDLPKYSHKWQAFNCTITNMCISFADTYFPTFPLAYAIFLPKVKCNKQKYGLWACCLVNVREERNQGYE